MEIGSNLRAFREHKKLTQGDIEKRTGLLRAYISRVENGHTVPSIGTLEKLAHALEVPLYQLLYDGATLKPSKEEAANLLAWSDLPKGRKLGRQFRRLLTRMNERDRNLLFSLAQWMAHRD